MSNLITLTCPSCGGRLEVTNNTERYVCAHCGNAHIVDPGVRAESLVKEVDVLKNESAMRRLESEIEELEKRKQALRASVPTIKSPEIEAALIKWGGVGLLVIVALAVMLVGSQAGQGGFALYICVALPFGVTALLLAKYGLLDKPTLDRWQARYTAAVNELSDVERRLARKREELERRKRLQMAGTANN